MIVEDGGNHLDTELPDGSEKVKELHEQLKVQRKPN